MSRFPTTQWSLVEVASHEAPTGSREQMGKLLDCYWQPMYAHVRYKGLDVEQAEDLIQDFVIEILNKDLLAIADPRKGRFRTLLLTALDRFMITRRRYETAAKRSPGTHIRIDAMEAEVVVDPNQSPSLAFELAWALDVLARALARMHEACDRLGQTQRWTVFERRIVAPLLDDAPAAEYAELVTELGLEDEKAAMNLLVTAKRQFARTLRDVVRDYVTRSCDSRQHARSVANRMMNDDNPHIDQDSAMRLARQLTEQSTGRAVEDEIQQLQAILSRSQHAGDWLPVQPSPSGDTSIYMSKYWQQLTKDHSLSSHHLQIAFDWGTEQPGKDGIPIEAHFVALMAMDVRELAESSEVQSISLEDCLKGESPSLDTLAAIKDWANRQRISRPQTLPSDLASGLYYLAIAVALVKCGTSMTGLHDHALKHGFDWLLAQAWLSNDLRDTVDSARQAI